MKLQIIIMCQGRTLNQTGRRKVDQSNHRMVAAEWKAITGQTAGRVTL